MADSRLQMEGPNPQQLISPSFAGFLSSHVLADEVLQVHLHNSGGPSRWGGWPLQLLHDPIAADGSGAAGRSAEHPGPPGSAVGIDVSFSTDANAADVSLYLD